MIRVAVSGFYDFFHCGHLESFKLAKELGDWLIVFIDGDNRTIAKKGYVCMPAKERLEIIKAIKYVDEVHIIDTCIADALEQYKPNIFAKGGDRTIDNLPKEEIDVCERNNIQIFCGIGDKIQASSSLIANLLENIKIKETRPWGKFEVIGDGLTYKIKKLYVNPNESLSLQMHLHRSEHWIVVSGTAKIIIGENQSIISENDCVYIPKATKHQLSNDGVIPLEIIEVQYGTYLKEDDIVRFEDKYGREVNNG